MSLNTVVPHPYVGRLGIWCATPRGHRQLTQSPTAWGEVPMVLTRRSGHYWQRTRCTTACAPTTYGSTIPFLSDHCSPRATFLSVPMRGLAGQISARVDTDCHPAGHHGRILICRPSGKQATLAICWQVGEGGHLTATPYITTTGGQDSRPGCQLTQQLSVTMCRVSGQFPRYATMWLNEFVTDLSVGDWARTGKGQLTCIPPCSIRGDDQLMIARSPRGSH